MRVFPLGNREKVRKSKTWHLFHYHRQVQQQAPQLIGEAVWDLGYQCLELLAIHAAAPSHHYARLSTFSALLYRPLNVNEYMTSNAPLMMPKMPMRMMTDWATSVAPFFSGPTKR